MSLTIGEVAGLINVGILFCNRFAWWNQDGQLRSNMLLTLHEVLSPIGLSEGVQSNKLVNATFAYAPDPSVFGEATFSRDNYVIFRTCVNGARPCPGVELETEHEDGGRVVNSTLVPENITDCFSSGVSSPGDLRSSSFDIEFRQFSWSEQRLNPFNIDWQSPVQNTYATYEDHVIKYGYSNPEGHGLLRFDSRLRDASTVFTNRVVQEFNSTGNSRGNWTITPEALKMTSSDFLSLVWIYTQETGLTTMEQPNDDQLDASPIASDGNGTRTDPAVESCLNKCTIAHVDCLANTCGLTVNFLKDAKSKPSIVIPFVICYYFVPAPIKVRFSYNDTGGGPSLSGLRVLDVSPKKYDRDEDRPLWAVENLGSNWTIKEISLQWGIISKEASLKYADGTRTLRSEKLLLPVFLEDGYNGNGWGNSLERQESLT
ncbi:hypothetical protein B0T22DRAFT_444303 [Podospora appendiculata]|uniref:Uncharacterized protein n=1 Tax=Podospora appendiculata TaxID=314037 RepID=A0AAE0X091_9PEZI|nr:hypothetical protein B0T22DRAFT_444303 [Podospora appendiculata]